jgi:hypothetical protein
MPFPAGRPTLKAGTRYLWEVRCQDPLGQELTQRRAFRVASESDRSAFDSARSAIEASAVGAIGLLLEAQLAIRLGCYREAEAAARAYVRTDESDALGRETLYHLLQLVGSSEARTLGIEGTGRSD